GRICIGKGSRPQAIYPGDTVMIPPNTMHWHGAAPDRLFAHLAMSENDEQGQGTSWAENVSDGDYKMEPEQALPGRLGRECRQPAALRFRWVPATRRAPPRPRRPGSPAAAGSGHPAPYGRSAAPAPAEGSRRSRDRAAAPPLGGGGGPRRVFAPGRSRHLGL